MDWKLTFNDGTVYQAGGSDTGKPRAGAGASSKSEGSSSSRTGRHHKLQRVIRFLCYRHFDKEKARKGRKHGIWAKIHNHNVVPGVEIRCNHPGCRNTITTTSPGSYWMWTFFSDRNKRSIVHQLQGTHLGWATVTREDKERGYVDREHKG